MRAFHWSNRLVNHYKSLYRPRRYVPGWPSHWSRDVVLSCFVGTNVLPQKKRSEGTWFLFWRRMLLCGVSTGEVKNGGDLRKFGYQFGDFQFQFWDISKMLIICNRADF
ncbi:hypothetical protein AVEN_239792-1 [Araneus ventricosus]|uniref:Uncharacterized protein n=1 Tax=Araneus ventricosus TaxID=182803 RepID=A0A4Y2EU70_ARAVE|nr:hypothetical protein AVEN_239792-1 [Araneus ventricosus]